MVYLLLSARAPLKPSGCVQKNRSYNLYVIHVSHSVQGFQAFLFRSAVLWKNVLQHLYGLRTVKPFMRFKLGGFVYGKSHG